MVGQIAGAALGLGVQAFALYKSAQENKKYNAFVEANYKDQQGKNTNWYNKEYYQDYLGGIEAKSALRNVMDQVNKRNQALTNTAAITGASDESQLAAREKGNETYAGFVNNLAARGQSRKNQVSDNFQARQSLLDQNYANQKADISKSRQQTWQTLMASAPAIGESMGNAIGGGMGGSKASGVIGNQAGSSSVADMAKIGLIV